MSKEYKAKVFKSGNSLALRLPKALGLVDGDEMVLREERGKYSFEPTLTKPRTIDLTGIYGSMPGLKALISDDRMMEPRDLDWDGKLLRRG
ncbi:AbrB/MazE/SpoVT family DNA-binding domain-containing protein [Sphingobium boeckii]|uniref:Antitoxin VapB n=1 Tax=Sphingobium boeckii TaxID=1082345 RepID=A0A7W9EFC9_9SPHN|nr:AbrB/MazE/SpoVT family DNA-binding domain-containing protein [Sphingobium boeckii]MBB5687183.1 antitoxin VapB [Sphingobium boeckii]